MTSTRILISTPIQMNNNAKIIIPEDQITQSIIPPSREGEMISRAPKWRSELIVVELLHRISVIISTRMSHYVTRIKSEARYFERELCFPISLQP